MKTAPRGTMAGAYPGTKQMKAGTPKFGGKPKTNPMDRAKALRQKPKAY